MRLLHIGGLWCILVWSVVLHSPRETGAQLPPTVPGPPELWWDNVTWPTKETEVTVYWSTFDDTHGFLLEFRTETGAWTEIADFPRAIRSHTQTGLTPSTTYYFRIRAYNEAGVSEYSPEVQAKTLAPPPNTPVLAATAISHDHILLQWNNVATDLTNAYRLEKQSGDEWLTVAYPTASETNHVVGALEPSTAYSFRIMAEGRTGRSDWGHASATTAAFNPLAPALSADAETRTTILLRWTDSETRSEYRIERKKVEGEWTEAGVVGGNVSEFLDKELEPSTLYFYRVLTVDSTGSPLYSNEATARTFAGEGAVPMTPAFKFVYAREDYVLMDWYFNEDVHGYQLEANTGPGGSWKEIAQPSGGYTRFVHEGLTASTLYKYRLRAHNDAGFSDYADIEVMTPPPRAANLVLEAIPLSHKQIELRWNDMATDVLSGYTIESSLGSDWIHTAFLGPFDTNYITGGSPSTTYLFRIKVHNANGWSDWSYASATTLPVPEIPPQMSPGLFADMESHSAIRLKWHGVEFATEYRIERKTLSGEWEQIATVGTNSIEYINDGLQPSTTYAYRIRAANSYGTSPYSNESAAKTAATPHPPEVPILFGGASSETLIQLYWEPAQGAVRYRLEKKSELGEWQVIYETDALPFRYNDEGLQIATLYHYRLAGQNAAGEWIYSAELATRTYPPRLTEAPAVSASAISSTAIELTWPSIPYAEAYFIWKLVNGTWEPTELGPGATNHIDTGLSASTTFSYRVEAMNLVGVSPRAEVTATTHAAISGDIVIRSIVPSPGGMRLLLSGSTGQSFRVEGTVDFQTWADITDTLTLSGGMEVEVPGDGAMRFYRTRRVE